MVNVCAYLYQDLKECSVLNNPPRNMHTLFQCQKMMMVGSQTSYVFLSYLRPFCRIVCKKMVSFSVMCNAGGQPILLSLLFII